MFDFSPETQLLIFQISIFLLKSVFWLLIFLILASVWSFLGVIIYRRYKEKKDWYTTLTERSHCNNCWHKLSYLELIPIFSFLFLKWKCRKCKTRIGWFHLLIEFVSAVDLLTLIFIFFWKETGYLFTGWLQEILLQPTRLAITFGIFIVVCVIQVHWHRWLWDKIDLLLKIKKLKHS